MNPEGKVHDWTDLPEEELPELQNIATGGLNQEASRQMLENLQACKGRGKMREPPKKHQPLNMSLSPVRPSMNEQITENKQSIVGVFGGLTKGGHPVQNGKTFQSSYAEVFKNRRGIFEQGKLFGTQSQTLDDLNLVMPRVKSFSKPMNSKTANKPKGNRVQFDENQGKTDKSYHIANHHNVEHDGTSKSEMKNIDQKQSLSRSNNNSTKNTDTITNTETCQVPYWQPLSRSRTAPDLNSSNGNIISLAKKVASNDNSCVQTTSKVNNLLLLVIDGV